MITFTQKIWALLAVCCGLLVGTSGCGSKTVQKAIKDAKEKVTKTVEKTVSQVKDQVVNAARPSETHIELKLASVEAPLVWKKAKAEVAELGDRPVLINFESQQSKETGEFPKLLVSVRGVGSKLADLTGKAYPARIFLQIKPGQPAYSTQLNKPAQVLIEGSDETYVQAKLESAELIDSSGQESLSISGNLTALIPQPVVKEEAAAEKAAAPGAK